MAFLFNYQKMAILLNLVSTGELENSYTLHAQCVWDARIPADRDELLPIIIAIVNASMDSSCVPRALKCAQIRPLLKKPTLDPGILKHYRPVSNLPFIAKVLEKVVDTRIERHQVSNGLHEELQSAYRRSHSTETALLKVQSDILESLDNGCVTVLVMLDLSAAFDTLDHGILLHRFEKMEMPSAG